MSEPFSLNQIIAAEQASKKYIRVKRIYVDMVNNLHAGMILSEVFYWHLPNKEGKTRLRTIPDEKEKWMACRRTSWWDRSRLTPREFDQAMKKLVDSKIILKELFDYKGQKTLHVRINWPVFTEAYNRALGSQTIKPQKRRVILPGLPAIWDILIEVLNASDGVLPIGEGVEVSPIGDTVLPNGNTVLPVSETVSPIGNTYTTIDTTQVPTIELQESISADADTANTSDSHTVKEKESLVAKATEYVNTVAPVTEKNLYQEAVKTTFKIEFGSFNGLMVNFLTGSPKNKGKWKEWQVDDPPMIPIEIVGFGDWYSATYNKAWEENKKKPPVTPETLGPRIMEFRGQANYQYYVDRAGIVFMARMGIQTTPTQEPAEELPTGNTGLDARADEIIKLLTNGEAINEFVST